MFHEPPAQFLVEKVFSYPLSWLWCSATSKSSKKATPQAEWWRYRGRAEKMKKCKNIAINQLTINLFTLFYMLVFFLTR